MTNRTNHPLKQFLRDVGGGMQPSPAQIDDIAHRVIDGSEASELSFPVLRRHLKEATEKIVAYRAEGSKGAGRSHAIDVADALVEKVGDYVPVSVPNEEMDPRKLSEGLGHQGGVPLRSRERSERAQWATGGSRPVTDDEDPNSPRNLAKAVEREETSCL